MRSKRHFSRRAKKPVRWFVSNQTYVDALTDLTLNSAALIPTASILAQHQRSAVMTPELVEQLQRHTIETIRGEILVHGDDILEPDHSVLLIYHAGVRVVELLPNGAPQLYDPSVSNEADDNWMWLHHRLVPPNPGDWSRAATGSQPVHPMPGGPIEVHIQSKRRMTDNEALVLYERCTTTAPEFAQGTVIHRYAYLRTLVSHPE